MRRIGLLLLIAIPIALVAAFVLANVRETLNRSRQKHTMADMRTIAIAIESYATDRKTFAIDSAATSTSEDFASLTPVSFDALERALRPVYIRNIPRRDAWGNDFEVRVGVRDYAIRSSGRDGRYEKHTYPIKYTTIQSFDEDLVFSDGNWLQAPEGI